MVPFETSRYLLQHSSVITPMDVMTKTHRKSVTIRIDLGFEEGRRRRRVDEIIYSETTNW